MQFIVCDDPFFYASSTLGATMPDQPIAAGKSSFNLIDAQKAFKLMDCRPGDHVLDLACGVGNYSLELAKQVGETGLLHAADLWADGLAALDEHGLANIKTIHADIRETLPLPDGSLDHCLMATVMHDLSPEDQAVVLQDIDRLLKPGGRLHIIEFLVIDNGPGPPRHIRMSPSDVEAVVRPIAYERIAGQDIGEYNYLLTYRKSL
jgi:ubiquinone/menaquinone biosynthesis C-methylase UbiE